jgi:hypothetical protein
MTLTTTELLARQKLVSSFVKPASQLRGLVFGNSIDKLLRGGLAPRTLTFLYGADANRMMNTLCSNSIRIFGGKVVYIDAANSFDPYFIVRSNYPQSEKVAREFLQSVIVSRAFTCYQLRKLVTDKLGELIADQNNKGQQKITTVLVSGISSVFSEEDNAPDEIEVIELLMAQTLRQIALDKNNGVSFVAVSSNSTSMNFISKSDTAIKFFFEEEEKKGVSAKKKRSSREMIQKAILMKHYSRKFKTITLSQNE